MLLLSCVLEKGYECTFVSKWFWWVISGWGTEAAAGVCGTAWLKAGELHGAGPRLRGNVDAVVYQATTRTSSSIACN